MPVQLNAGETAVSIVAPGNGDPGMVARLNRCPFSVTEVKSMSDVGKPIKVNVTECDLEPGVKLIIGVVCEMAVFVQFSSQLSTRAGRSWKVRNHHETDQFHMNIGPA